MSNTPHELHDDFPELAEKISEMKAADPDFAKLTDDYHAVNRAVHRAETDIEPTDDLHLTEMRKERALLKDQIYHMLTHDAPA